MTGPTTRVPMVTKRDRMVTYLDRLLSIKSYEALILRDRARSRDKLKPLYLNYYSAYDHQTCQSGNLPWGGRIVIVTWPFTHVVLLDHVTN